MTGTTIDTDEQLVARAVEGNEDALGTLLDRHLHPAWRMGLATCVDRNAAEAAVVAGVCDALAAAHRDPEQDLSLRSRIAAAVHAAALEGTQLAEVPSDPVLAAFASLPMASRAALWLTVVEGAEPASTAPLLGVSPGVAVAMAKRASTSLRERLGPGAGIPVPALRRMVTAVPATVRLAIAARLAEAAERDRPLPVAGHTWNRRLVGAAAAGVVALGLVGALLFGGGGSGSFAGPEVAQPAAVDLSHLNDEDPTPITFPTGSPIPLGPTASTGGGTWASGTSTSTGTSARTPDAADRSRGGAPAPAPAPTTSTTVPRSTTTTTRPPATTTTTMPPTTTTTVAASDGGTPAATSPDATQATVEVPGVAVGAGDCTGVNVAGTPAGCDPAAGEPTVTVEVPGLPPISLLP